MPIRTSNPASYDKIFEIYKNGTAVLSSGTTTTLPNNRGVLIITGTSAFTFRLYNLEHTTSVPSYADLIIPANTTIILPIQIKYYTVTAGTGCSIYGLL